MQYKFKNQHALAVIAILVFIVIVGRISFRPRTYVSDLSLVSWMLAVVAITSACASYFFSRSIANDLFAVHDHRIGVHMDSSDHSVLLKLLL